jgi:hypothetical protein
MFNHLTIIYLQKSNEALDINPTTMNASKKEEPEHLRNHWQLVGIDDLRLTEKCVVYTPTFLGSSDKTEQNIEGLGFDSQKLVGPLYVAVSSILGVTTIHIYSISLLRKKRQEKS